MIMVYSLKYDVFPKSKIGADNKAVRITLAKKQNKTKKKSKKLFKYK